MTFNPLEHVIALDEPRMLTDASAWVEHIPFAFWIVSALRPRSIVELGAHKGDSYCAFCQAVATLSLPCACAAVDTWAGDKHSGAYGEEVFNALRAHHDPLYAGFSRLVRSTFDDAAPTFDAGAIDLLHIDGLHTYDAVRHDFETWLPKLSARAVVLFHDTAERAADFGVWRLWEELSASRPHFAFAHAHGLGVLGVGADLPASIRALFDAPAAEAESIRRFFIAAGRAVALRRALGLLTMSVYNEQQAVNEWKRRIGSPIQPHSTVPQAALMHPLAYFRGYAGDVRAILQADLQRRGGGTPGR